MEIYKFKQEDRLSFPVDQNTLCVCVYVCVGVGWTVEQTAEKDAGVLDRDPDTNGAGKESVLPTHASER
jgi:hypothetical protein